MGDLSNTMKGYLLDWMKNTNMPAAPAQFYVGLYTAAPTDAGGGTPVAGGSYARQAIDFADSAAGVVANNAPVSFPEATADWGTVTHFAIFDHVSAGNMIAWDALVTPKTIATGDTLTFDTGDLTFTAD